MSLYSSKYLFLRGIGDTSCKSEGGIEGMGHIYVPSYTNHTSHASHLTHVHTQTHSHG